MKFIVDARYKDFVHILIADTHHQQLQLQQQHPFSSDEYLYKRPILSNDDKWKVEFRKGPPFGIVITTPTTNQTILDTRDGLFIFS